MHSEFWAKWRPRFRFSIRAMLVLIALAAFCLAFLLPYFDDTRFADSLQQFHNRPVNELVEHARKHGRKIGTQWSAKRQLIGLTVKLLDGRHFEVGVDENGPISVNYKIDLSTLGNCKVVESNPEVVGGFVGYLN